MIDQISNIDFQIIDAFHQMCDVFPGSVHLIHKNHTVLPVDPVTEKR